MAEYNTQKINVSIKANEELYSWYCCHYRKCLFSGKGEVVYTILLILGPESGHFIQNHTDNGKGNPQQSGNDDSSNESC